MRTFVRRATLGAVGAALAIIAIPTFGVFAFVATRSPGQREPLLHRTLDTLGRAGLLLAPLVLSGVALAVGALLANRHADRLGGLVGELATRAEEVGGRPTSRPPLACGIREIDLVDRALTERAADVAQSMAASRDFAANASHQLRTPLTALLMRLEEIATTDDLDVVRVEAGIGIAQVDRLAKVVDDLLARNTDPTSTRPAVSLDSVIAALQREWQPTFAQARRSVHVRGERGLFVQVTPGALSQILSTLLENALAHGSGTVEVAARRSGPSVIVEVGDHGRGIDHAIAPHIFERSVSTKGSGLGLALARDLAEAAGGRLELTRAQPALFVLFLSEAPAP